MQEIKDKQKNSGESKNKKEKHLKENLAIDL